MTNVSGQLWKSLWKRLGVCTKPHITMRGKVSKVTCVCQALCTNKTRPILSEGGGGTLLMRSVGNVTLMRPLTVSGSVGAVITSGNALPLTPLTVDALVFQPHAPKPVAMTPRQP